MLISVTLLNLIKACQKHSSIKDKIKKFNKQIQS